MRTSNATVVDILSVAGASVCACGRVTRSDFCPECHEPLSDAARALAEQERTAAQAALRVALVEATGTAVVELEAACRRLAPYLTHAQQLELTCLLLALRRAVGMPGKLVGPSGWLPPRAA